MVNTQLEVTAPDFTAKDSDNRDIRLSDYRGKKLIVLVFNRGFQCPYCRAHMAQLRQDYQEFVNRGAEIIVIGPDNADVFVDYWHSKDMPFPGIPDPRHDIADVYGQKVEILKFGRMPALLVIDKEGKIRYRHYSNSMSDIPRDQEILSLLDSLNKENKPEQSQERRNA